jgi:glycosyltransferase involved in cell wall biosynthesis
MFMRRDSAPTVTVITPSYNMAQFLEETIRSVLAQGYPQLEYVVMDGGSSDGTLAILERHRAALRYVSAPDAGVVDALNSGFRSTRGSIVGWLNADDTYLPGAIETAVEYLLDHPEVDAVYGQAHWVDESGRTLGPYPTRPYDPSLFGRECFICQPACFIRRSALEAVGMLDQNLHFGFDYDLWIRLSKAHRFAMVPGYLATSRMHRGNKTLGQRGEALRESMSLLRRHYSYVPFAWIHAYCSYVRDRRDQFYEPERPSLATYLLALPVGTWYNAGSVLRFWREWVSVMSMAAALRRWNEGRLAKLLRLRIPSGN